MATFDPLRLAASTEARSRLHVVRKPSIRVRQAVRDNNVALLARLQHKVDLRNTDKMRLTSLAWAALESNVEVFEWLLLDYGHDDQELSRDAEHNTIFHLLAASTAPLAVSPHTHLLMSNPDFPPRPPSKTPAELANACHRMTEVYYTLFPFLVDWSNTSGKTALHVAAQANNAEFLNQLCDLGADVSLADLQGNTPLHYASAWGHTDCIRVLLERGANTGIRNFEGFTASDFAYSHHVRGALDAIAREVAEERRARRREEKAQRQQERERAERAAYERERGDERGSISGSRIRSGSASTSASGVSGQSSSHSGARRDPEPPMPALPPSVAKAAAAAALARNERRAAERGGPYPDSRPGSPTPMPSRTADNAVPTLLLSSTHGTPTPGGARNVSQLGGSPTPVRKDSALHSPLSNPSSSGPSPTSSHFPHNMRRTNSSQSGSKGPRQAL